MLVNPIQSSANIGEFQFPTLEPQRHMEIRISWEYYKGTRDKVDCLSNANSN